MTQKRFQARVLAAVLFGILTVGAVAKPKPDPLSLQARGSETNFVFPDVKTPGKPELKLRAKTFSINSLQGGFQGDLLGVSATLFQHGVPTAKLAAPRVKGNNLQNLLVASGRVTANSLVQKGTVLQADTMRWYPKTNKIYADGHVFYREGKSGGTVYTPHLVADTALKSLSGGG